MKHLLKSSILALALALSLSSCSSYYNLNKKEPVTREFLSTLKTGKRYEFKSKTGTTMKIYIIHGILKC